MNRLPSIGEEGDEEESVESGGDVAQDHVETPLNSQVSPAPMILESTIAGGKGKRNGPIVVPIKDRATGFRRHTMASAARVQETRCETFARGKSRNEAGSVERKPRRASRRGSDILDRGPHPGGRGGVLGRVLGPERDQDASLASRGALRARRHRSESGGAMNRHVEPARRLPSLDSMGPGAAPDAAGAIGWRKLSRASSDSTGSADAGVVDSVKSTPRPLTITTVKARDPHPTPQESIGRAPPAVHTDAPVSKPDHAPTPSRPVAAPERDVPVDSAPSIPVIRAALPHIDAHLDAGCVAGICGNAVADTIFADRTEAAAGASDSSAAALRFGTLVTLLETVATTGEYPLIAMTPQCTIVFCSPSLTDLLGYGADDLLGANISAIMPEAIGARHDAIVAGFVQAVARGSGHEASSVVGNTRPVTARAKDGSLITVELSVTAATAARGGGENGGSSGGDGGSNGGSDGGNGVRVALFIAQLRDLRTDLSLRSIVKESRLLQMRFPFPFIEASEAMIIQQFNPAAERAFGISESRAVGKNVSILMPRHLSRPGTRKRIRAVDHDKIVRNFVSKVRAVGEANVTSRIVGQTTRHTALRVGRSDPRSIAPEQFRLELEVRMAMSADGTVKFLAFARDCESFLSAKEVRDAAARRVVPGPVADSVTAGDAADDGAVELAALHATVRDFDRVQALLGAQQAMRLASDIFAEFQNVLLRSRVHRRVHPVSCGGGRFLAVAGLGADDRSLSGNGLAAAVDAAAPWRDTGDGHVFAVVDGVAHLKRGNENEPAAPAQDPRGVAHAAIAAAVDMDIAAKRVARQHGVDVHVSFGIARGPCITRTIGAGHTKRFAVVGEPVNTARHASLYPERRPSITQAIAMLWGGEQK